MIDTDDYAASGIEILTFPGGEPHANVPLWPYKDASIHVKIREFENVGPLLAVTDALKSQGVNVHYFAPYIPGLRQDRNFEGRTPLTSRIYGHLFAQADTITTLDPHSEMGFSHFRRAAGNNSVRIIDPVVYLPAILTMKYTHIIIPDTGAVDRTTRVAEILGIPNIVQAHKHRDEASGRLSAFSLDEGLSSDSNSPMPRNSRILIADDICDGGGTFLGIMSVLRRINYEIPCDLYVTHGIFSQGFDKLLGKGTGNDYTHGFSHIYTTDSWHESGRLNESPSRVTTLPLAPYYLGGLHP